MITVGSIPVDPDVDDARDRLARELSDPAYRAAEPNWLDRLSGAVWDWFSSLLGSADGAPPALLMAVIIVALVAALLVAYLVFGPPRLNRRSRANGAVFGEDDVRDSAAIRAAAEAAAAAGDFAVATEEMFRAVARGLTERAVVAVTPGTTATGFAMSARGAFPALEGDLTSAAQGFDEVRYLGHPGSEAGFARVAALERDLRHSTPRFDSATSA